MGNDTERKAQQTLTAKDFPDVSIRDFGKLTRRMAHTLTITPEYIIPFNFDDDNSWSSEAVELLRLHFGNYPAQVQRLIDNGETAHSAAHIAFRHALDEISGSDRDALLWKPVMGDAYEPPVGCLARLFETETDFWLEYAFRQYLLEVIVAEAEYTAEWLNENR